MNYSDKTAIITGAASGIGCKVAESLYEKGCQVVLCDIRDDELHHHFSHYDQSRIELCRLDVRVASAWEQVRDRVIARFGRIDILMNIAGVLEAGNIYETSIDAIDRQIDINLKGTIYGINIISPVMVRQRRGHIINISSMAGLAPIQGMNIYSATKFGVRGFSLACAYELMAYGVHVNVLCPDAVHTPMLDKEKDTKAAAMTFSAARLLTVSEVEKAIINLLEKPKVEKWLPIPRGILATLGALFPSIALLLKDKLIKKGLKKQAAYVVSSQTYFNDKLD